MIIYKHDKLKAQFEDFLDPRLQAFMFWLEYYIDLKYKKDVTVTCVNRTLKENKSVGGIKDSAHLVGRGIDIRSWCYSLEEIKQLVKFVNDVWGDFIYITYHNSGSGDHIHINISWKYHIRSYC